jgi:hypothetical protein
MSLTLAAEGLLFVRDVHHAVRLSRAAIRFPIDEEELPRSIGSLIHHLADDDRALEVLAPLDGRFRYRTSDLAGSLTMAAELARSGVAVEAGHWLVHAIVTATGMPRTWMQLVVAGAARVAQLLGVEDRARRWCDAAQRAPHFQLGETIVMLDKVMAALPDRRESSVSPAPTLDGALDEARWFAESLTGSAGAR